MSTLLTVGMSGLPAAAGSPPTPPRPKPHIQPLGDGNWKSTPAPKPAPVAGWKSPKGKDAPLVKADPHAKRVSELTDKRTANASFYKMSDGSVQEELSAVPVHYRDSHGKWQSIDTSVKPLSHAGYVAGATGNTFQTYFGSSASSLIRMEQGSSSIQMGLDGATVSAPKVSGETATYANALPGTDLSYQTGPDGVAEKIVLAKAPASGPAYSFSLKVSGFTPKQLADGAIAFYGSESANPAFVIPAPYMSDSKPDVNSPYGLAYSAKVSQAMTFDAASGTVHVTVTPDASWLADKARVYPVTVDPTIVVSSTSATAANVMILADGATTNYDTSWRLSVGTTATGAARSLIKFALPTVPAGTTLTSADLQLYYDQTFTTGTNTVPMQALAANAAWDPTTATWSNASTIGGSVAGTSQMTANQLAVWNDFPVTSTVQSWLNGTLTNNGFVLKATNEATLGQGGPRYEGSGYYYGGEVKNYPKLVLTYGVPGVTVNAPTVIHSTGAELSWPAYSNTTGNSANDIAEYQVHRSIYQTFTPTAGTEISPISSSQTSFVDSTAVPTPANNSDPYGNAYYYMVVVKTKSGALISGPTTVVRLPEAGRTTLLIPARSATTLSSTEPTTVLNTLSNAGTPQPWLEVGDNSGTYGITRSVFNFPALTAVPSGSTVLDAHLKLWQETTTTNTSGAVYELHPLTKPFTGTQATWNSAATGTAWTAPGGDIGAVDGTLNTFTNDPNRRNFDATSIVQGWVNTPSTADGLLVKEAAEGSTAPQERTIFAGPATAEPALAPTLVVTYLDSSTGSTYYAPSTPTDMNPGTTYSVPVTINNTTATAWTAANDVLTYHWLLPDGTDVTGTSQLQTALPSDLAPAGTVTLNAQVTPPTPTDGNQAEGATLAWDMYNKSTGVYLSSGGTFATAQGVTKANTAYHSSGLAAMAAGTGGIGSLQQQVSVDPSGNNQLGLEKFYPYTTTDTGSGGTLYSNTASGNTVWNDELINNPSVGFSTTLGLSYNSMSTMDTTTGFGWSIEASAPIRLGSNLQFHPQTNPTSIVMVDGTGNAHQWKWGPNPNDGNKTEWISPPGVHLFLQGTACKPQDTNARAWSMTRPDRTTYYFDCEGYPTAQIDANGNEADFSYTQRQSQNKPEEFLDYISDPLHNQTLTLSYYNKGDSYSSVDPTTGSLVPGTNLTDPAIIDHVKSITDISGRTIDLYYTSNGLLGQMVDGAGTPIAKTFGFSYDATQGMKNVKLVSVKDPRGNGTGLIYYPTSSATKWWTKSVTNRDSQTTTFAYTLGTSGNSATVTDPKQADWVYDTDSFGRLTSSVDPAVNGHASTTTIGWDTDNNVTDVTEDNGAHSQWNYNLNTGFPNWYKDALAVKNNTAATAYTYATTVSTDPLTGHVAWLTDTTSPMGRRSHYTYYPLNPTDPGYVATAGYAGNVATVQAPDGTASGAPANSSLTTYTYDMYGQVASVKDADNNTTTYNRFYTISGSSTQFPEPTGQPRTVTDALLNTTSYVYGSRGELTSTTDPLGHTSTEHYDVFLRPLDSVSPKDATSGTTITTAAPVYDANDNVTQVSAPIYTGASTAGAVMTTAYGKDDQPLTVTAPPNNGTAARVTTYGYDANGNRTSVTEPLGNPAASPPTYTTTTHFDPVNEVDWSTDAAGDKTQYGYDTVGNKVTVTDPRLNVSQTAYDVDHQVTGTTDAAGATTSIAYDLDGVKLSTTDQVGTTVNYTVDANGQVTQVQVPHAMNPSGTATEYDDTQYVYDQAGNNVAVISPKGVAAGSTGATGPFTTSTQYDPDNRVSKVLGAFDPTDALYKADQQPETDYHYDTAGRVTSVDRLRKANAYNGITPGSPEDAKTAYTYFDNGWTQSSSDPFHITTSYDYNAAGQQVTREVASSDSGDTTGGVAGVSGGQRYLNWGYYPDGSLQSYKDTGLPDGWQDQIVTADSWNTSTSGWNAGAAGGGYDGSTYYTSGSGDFTWNLAVPQKGDYQVYVWDSKAGAGGAVYNFIDSGGVSHSLGALDQTKNAGTWQVLNQGATISLSAGAGTGTGNGNQSIQLVPGVSGNIADAVKIVCTDCGTGTTQADTFSYSYDANGNLSDIADGSPNAQFDHYTPTFNNLDKLTQLVEKKAGTAVHTLTYHYDPAGNLDTQTQDQSSGTFVHNALNELSQVTDTQNGGAPLVTGYMYYPNGQLRTETKDNKNVVTNSYNYDGTLAGSIEATSTGTTVDSHLLSYDSNNNVTEDKAAVQNAGSGTLSQDSILTYSPNNQVTSETNGKDDQKYIYDSAGNIEEQTLKDPTSGANATTDFTYDRDRLYAATPQAGTGGIYQYDTLGRLHDVANGLFQLSGTVSQQYSYDGFDNLTSQTSITSDGSGGQTSNTTTTAYDSLNRAVSQAINPGSATSQSEKLDYLGTSGTVADETVSIPAGAGGAGTAADTITKTYDYSANGERLALLNHDPNNAPATDQTEYYTYNQHADVEALTNSTGSTTGTYGYTAYGVDDKNLDSGTDTVGASPTAFPFNAYRFNSARISTTSGNLSMGARSYDPNINRFVSRDSYNGAGADAGLSGGSRYGFAGGNPISNVEQDGHSFLSWLGGAGGGVIGGWVGKAIGYGVCNALLDAETAGAGIAICAGVASLAGAVVGGAAGTVAAQGVSCAETGGSACSGGAFASAAGEGAVFGAVAEGVAVLLPETMAGWAAGGLSNAAGGAASYGVGCAVGAECSFSGLAEATAFSGALGAVFGAFGGPKCGGQSFTADTQVQLADGSTKPISQMKAGDKVKSTDTATGKTKDSTASEVLVNHDTDLYDLTVHTAKGDQVVHTTAHHLFFDKTRKNWVEAAKLPKGDQLTTDDGSAVTAVGGLTPAKSDGDMWDLTVPGDHDFYVEAGGTTVLVHNCGGDQYDWNGQVRYGALDDLKRPTGIDAMVTRDMLNKGSEAGSRRTPGWRGNGTLFNEARGHLLAGRLGGRGVGRYSKYNLVTLEQTPTNSPLMRDMFEQWVYDTVKAEGSVQYSVKPVYAGTNPIPISLEFSGVGAGGSTMSGFLDNPAAGVRTAVPNLP
ncbi:DNRLRE domain-containing protein [Catenulispora sp. GAS73]|uniref:DNRLRE domain-containing protein n=1 Tax=Catenulispora sp. GAS73 TaxID=3156269 RepID=UPI0035153DFC